MYYEQDYIMRLIKQVIRALIGTLLNRRTTLEHEMLANQQQNSGEDLFQRLAVLADQGKICEAENMLLEAMESGSDEALRAGLLFYEHINEYDDDYLEEHNFSRAEIRQGVLDTAERMGTYAMAAPLFPEFYVDGE